MFGLSVKRSINNLRNTLLTISLTGYPALISVGIAYGQDISDEEYTLGFTTVPFTGLYDISVWPPMDPQDLIEHRITEDSGAIIFQNFCQLADDDLSEGEGGEGEQYYWYMHTGVDISTFMLLNFGWRLVELYAVADGHYSALYIGGENHPKNTIGVDVSGKKLIYSHLRFINGQFAGRYRDAGTKLNVQIANIASWEIRRACHLHFNVYNTSASKLYNPQRYDGTGDLVGPDQNTPGEFKTELFETYEEGYRIFVDDNPLASFNPSNCAPWYIALMEDENVIRERYNDEYYIGQMEVWELFTNGHEKEFITDDSQPNILDVLRSYSNLTTYFSRHNTHYYTDPGGFDEGVPSHIRVGDVNAHKLDISLIPSGGSEEEPSPVPNELQGFPAKWYPNLPEIHEVENAVAVADLDLPGPAGGYGNKEIVYTEREGNIGIVDSDGDFRNHRVLDGGHTIIGSPALGDMDNDGALEIVVADTNGDVYVLENLLQTVPPIYNLGFGTDCTPALGDIDGDGYLDIVIGNDGHDVHVIDRYGNRIWKRCLGSPVKQPVAIGDIDYDGDLDVAAIGYNFSSLKTEVKVWDSNGSELNGDWYLPFTHEFANDVKKNNQIMLADFDFDGDLEVVFAVGETISDPEKIHCIDKNKQIYGGFPIQEKSNGDILIGDFDRSGNQDIAIANHTEWREKKLSIYNPNSGARAFNIPLWCWNIDTHSVIFSADSDNSVEVVFPGWLNGEPLHRKNNLHGSNLFDGYPPSRPQYSPEHWNPPLGLTHLCGEEWQWYRYGAEAAPKVADVNRDGYADIIIPDRHANIHVYSTEATRNPLAEEYHWGEYGHDPLNTFCFEPFAPTKLTTEDVPDDQGHALKIKWRNSLDDGEKGIRSRRINRYYVFRSDPQVIPQTFAFVGSVPKGTFEYTDEGIPPLYTFDYYVVGSTSNAVEWPGYNSPPHRFSQHSPIVSGQAHDNIPPAPPTNFDLEVLEEGGAPPVVHLTWTRSIDDPIYQVSEPDDGDRAPGGAVAEPFGRPGSVASPVPAARADRSGAAAAAASAAANDDGAGASAGYAYAGGPASPLFLSDKQGEAAKAKAGERRSAAAYYGTTGPRLWAGKDGGGFDGGAGDVNDYVIYRGAPEFHCYPTNPSNDVEYFDYDVTYGNVYYYSLAANDGENLSETVGPLVANLNLVPPDGGPLAFAPDSPLAGDPYHDPVDGPAAAAAPFADMGWGASRSGVTKVITCKPNPVTGTATFTITLPTACRVNLAVYDLAGRKVDNVLNKVVREGGEMVLWQPAVPSGVYIYRLETPNREYCGKVVIAR